ncbi:MAG: hypothetical protein JXA45_05725, partial [Methanomassiliicoccales archaeon]|nr:hypothetical protein [Methanomassiliicoccales archaeon]
MTDDPYQGNIIERFQGKWEENRNLDTFFRIYPFLGFLPLVSFIAVMYLLPNEHTDFLVPLVSPFLFIAGLGAYLVVQNILEKQRSPIIVHSNGIYLKGGHLDRLRRRTDFIPRSSIKNVEIDDVPFTNPN